MGKIKLEIEVEEDYNLYISDILCWIKGYLEGKGDDWRNHSLLSDACERLSDINRQLKNSLGENNDKS